MLMNSTEHAAIVCASGELDQKDHDLKCLREKNVKLHAWWINQEQFKKLLKEGVITEQNAERRAG